MINCQEISFSQKLQQQRTAQAQSILGTKVTDHFICFALYLLGASRKSISTLTNTPPGTIRSRVRAILSNGLPALEDRRSRSSTFLPPQEKGTVASIYIEECRCTSLACPAQQFEKIVHFASKGAMDIDGLGPAIVEKLLDKKLIKDVSDIYYLKYEDIYGLENFKQKSTQNLLNATGESKSKPLSRLIFALGIRYVGSHIAEVLAENYKKTLSCIKSV